ncbi:MAG: Wzz/FepE/Etk N-terminal domain-containing protein [Clostridiales bacterium]|nr:Wzz/FepE/Etk N-terminal domain-containing protein [Clostridiales bacterium]
MNESQKNALLQEENVETEVDVVALFYRLVEKLKFILAAALLGAILAGVYCYFIATPKYQATSKLYVVNSSDSVLNISDLQLGSYLTSDYKEVFTTWEVQEMVISNLNLPYTYSQLAKMVTIQNPSNSRILNITVTSSSAQEAARIANELANVGGEYITRMMGTSVPSVLSQALEPVRPVSPKKAQTIIIGFLLGFILAAAVFVIRFIVDDKIKTSDDIRRYIGMTTLAIIPVNEKVD